MRWAHVLGMILALQVGCGRAWTTMDPLELPQTIYATCSMAQ